MRNKQLHASIRMRPAGLGMQAWACRQLQSDGKAQLFQSKTEYSFSTCNPSTTERTLSTCAKECDAGKRQASLRQAVPQGLRFSMSLQGSRPRLEQSPERSSWRMRCATFPRRYVAAPRSRSSPRRRCERVWMVDRSSLGGLSTFPPMALPEVSVPVRGCPRTRISTCSPFRPQGP